MGERVYSLKGIIKGASYNLEVIGYIFQVNGAGED